MGWWRQPLSVAAQALSLPGREGREETEAFLRTCAIPKAPTKMRKICSIIKQEFTGAHMVQLGSISTIMQEESPEEQSVSVVEKTVRSLKGSPNVRTLRLDQPFIVNKKLEEKNPLTTAVALNTL